MTAAARAQIKVATKAEEVAEVYPLVDLRRPSKLRRVSFEDSVRRIRERYSDAIELLGKL